MKQGLNLPSFQMPDTTLIHKNYGSMSLKLLREKKSCSSSILVDDYFFIINCFNYNKLTFSKLGNLLIKTLKDQNDFVPIL